MEKEQRRPVFMQGLPIVVKSMSDVRKILRIYEDSVFRFRKDVKKIIDLLNPDEALYLLQTVSEAKVTRVNSNRQLLESGVGVVFASAKRFLIQGREANEVFECPIGEIQSIGKYSHLITFSTQTMSFEFETGGQTSHVRSTLINLAIMASLPQG